MLKIEKYFWGMGIAGNLSYWWLFLGAAKGKPRMLFRTYHTNLSFFGLLLLVPSHYLITYFWITLRFEGFTFRFF